MASPMRTGDEAFDAPERQKDHEGNCRAIGSAKTMLRAKAKPSQKSGKFCRRNKWTDMAQSWWTDNHHGLI